ncbi:hypothetical protein IFR09_27585 [Pseudomonas syringae]|nr:hypothetical protein [Pseudomonas syringae]MBD8789822.1 hypothetical protein [Pseudomonas syringae]MBD8801011.1 hypothetical protein [Pseudomonas syringae]MBD8814932.1 hypothetical protein [Pseudomonas syringae]
MRRVFAVTLLCLPTLALADCTELMIQWADQLHPGRTFDAQHSVCKVSPVDSVMKMAALVFIESEDADTASYGLEVLTAHNNTIERHVYQSQAISSDAIRFEGLSLDTARYQLNRHTRAFGVRARYSGSSRVNPYSKTELSLYVEDGNTLRKVLDKFEIASSGGEWDGNCAGAFYDTSSSLAIGKAVNKGYATLLVTDTSSGSQVIYEDDDCTSKDSKPVQNKYPMIYNGKQYQVPINKQG